MTRKYLFIAISFLLFSIASFAGNDDRNNTNAVIKLTDDNFGKEIKKGIVVVDFWAPWCGPCKMQGPIIDKLAFEAREKARFGKLDTDQNQTVSNLYQIESLPTLIIFKNGKHAKRFVGLTSKDELAKAIDEVIKE